MPISLKGFNSFVTESEYIPDEDMDQLSYVVIIKRDDDKMYLMVTREEAFQLKRILDKNLVEYSIGVRPDPLSAKKERSDENE